ncbi:MAG: hypothetical protein Q9163_003769 [Psora crenata]
MDPEPLTPPDLDGPEEDFNVGLIGGDAYAILSNRQEGDATLNYTSSTNDTPAPSKSDPKLDEPFNLAETAHSDPSLPPELSSLPKYLRDYSDIFDRREADKLPPYWEYGHMIVLTGEGLPPRSKIYPLSSYKLQKLKDKSKKEHHEHIRQVLRKLREAGLQADIRKRDFDVTRTKYWVSSSRQKA